MRLDIKQPLFPSDDNGKPFAKSYSPRVLSVVLEPNERYRVHLLGYLSVEEWVANRRAREEGGKDGSKLPYGIEGELIADDTISLPTIP